MRFFGFLCLLVTFCKCSLAEPTTIRYVYNSSDLSYYSNGIQFPAPENDFMNPIVGELENQEKQPDMLWIRDLYDHHKWVGYANKLNNTRCKKDLLTYISELNNGTSWATKIYDSAGRYYGQFFFGNDYWLGSYTLCQELSNEESNAEIPPFPLKFYMTKLRININRKLTPVTRQLNIGECIPASCTNNDLKILFQQEPKQGASINIIDIRPVPGDYSLLGDVKFSIVGGTAFFVGILMLIASIIDVVLKRKNKVNNEEPDSENNNSSPEGLKGSRELVINKNKRTNNYMLKLLLAFSAVENGKKILNVDNISRNALTCVHGLRFFSILWIILVHTYLEIFSVAGNKNVRIITERTFLYQTISNATFSVDTFFFISGLLVTITYFRAEAKKEKSSKDETTSHIIKTNTGKFSLMIFYRFFRLTPAYLFVLGVNELILRYLHNTSVFSPAIIDHITCSEYWWRNALYINNFFPQTEFCMLWSWYMANDTQFYFIASILLLIGVRSNRHLKAAACMIGVFLVTSWVTTFIIAMKYNYVARVEEPFTLFDQLYDKPWLRIGPYLIGMIIGYYLFKVDCKVKLKISVVAAGWILSLGCLAVLVYGLGREGLVVPASAIYASLGHTAWGLSLAWITVACVAGYGGPLNSLLSCKLLVPLSRLTYCAYLIHPVLMCLTSFLLDGPIHLHNVFAMVIFCGNAVISFLCAFLISLAFEAPVVNLLKLIL
ncbi:nose resistant to fluoxetine protein 6-like isoform X1 [Harmonia axyridis]|uniref:nose resistant to fluoxetine protein 6-like isoform X1 n=1 Tax=Harmonia axyridis TaxID=115357 RepID=UPI001E276FBA|nr:nose resistant to fluoxetine protein 6-like isoform X1 [Harmonia axyridis]